MDFRSAILTRKNDHIELIGSIVSIIRPGRLESVQFAESRIQELISLIKADEECRTILQFAINGIFTSSSSTLLLTTSGISGTGGIYSDIMQRIKHTILPPLSDKKQLTFAVNTIFNKSWDYRWVGQLPNRLWFELLSALEFNLNLVPNGRELEEVLNSILVLSHRLAVLGLDPILVSKVPGISNLDSPFFQQNKEITNYIEDIRSKQFFPDDKRVEYSYLLNTLDSCVQKLRFIHVNRNEIGAGLGLTYITRQLDLHVQRIRILLKILHEQKKQRTNSLIRLFKEIVEHENTKNKVRKHISANIGLLAFQVTENAAKTGEHYISSDRKEYFDFFKNSIGGGAIVAILVCIKVFITSQHLPPLIETISNGLNYGIGFLIIHFAGFTLATKQPAMTASALAGALEGGSDGKEGISDLARMIVKISRTQFVSFAGNLLMVFPVVWLMSWVWFMLTGSKMADMQKASKLISDLNPVSSLSAWYAMVAGVLLYAAGLISGYFDNKTVFSKIPERINQHPSLKWVPRSKLEKISAYIGDNLGSMSGNFILGFLLASMAFIGFILGLPLDVRHVTFVTGSFGLAIQNYDGTVPIDILWVTILSIFMIGFLNFIVSFSLAIFTAMRARRVRFSQTWVLLNLLRAYFFTYPLDFFFPPGSERKIELLDKNAVAEADLSTSPEKDQ